MSSKHEPEKTQVNFEEDREQSWLRNRVSVDAQSMVTVIDGRQGPHLDEPDAERAVITEGLQDRGHLSTGGMSEIRRVLDGDLLSEVALKVMAENLVEDKALVRRFVEEAQVTAQLDHPNIPAIHRLGLNARGQLCFTMKLVEGETLSAIITSPDYDPTQPKQLYDMLSVFTSMCNGVAFAHSKGVIHCDLKPANIMVGGHGQVYVMDWGIARLTQQPRTPDTDRIEAPILLERKQSTLASGKMEGTLGYMAPEQANGQHDQVDERTDVFGLGGVLYSCLTGLPPYFGSNSAQTLMLASKAKIRDPQEVAPDRHIPRRLCDIAMKALSRDPKDRYPDVNALRRDVEDFVRGVGHFPEREVAAGEAIISEGDAADAAYIVQSGSFRVLRSSDDGPRLITVLRQGDVFGETAIFSDAPRMATVEAVEDSRVLVITGDSLEEELGSTELLGPFVRSLADNFRKLDARTSGQARDLTNSSMINQVLRQLCLHGEATDEGRVTSWTGLARALERKHGWVAQRLAMAIRSDPTLTIDTDRDLLILRQR